MILPPPTPPPQPPSPPPKPSPPPPPQPPLAPLARLPCDLAPCFPGVRCINPTAVQLSRGIPYLCSACPPGFTGDGVSCEDVDECAAGSACDPLTACTNTPGSFGCSGCPDGYRGTGKLGCRRVAACADGNGGCDPLQPCTDTPGGPVCGACPDGALLLLRPPSAPPLSPAAPAAASGAERTGPLRGTPPPAASAAARMPTPRGPPPSPLRRARRVPHHRRRLRREARVPGPPSPARQRHPLLPGRPVHEPQGGQPGDRPRLRLRQLPGAPAPGCAARCPHAQRGRAPPPRGALRETTGRASSLVCEWMRRRCVPCPILSGAAPRRWASRATASSASRARCPLASPSPASTATPSCARRRAGCPPARRAPRALPPHAPLRRFCTPLRMSSPCRPPATLPPPPPPPLPADRAPVRAGAAAEDGREVRVPEQHRLLPRVERRDRARRPDPAHGHRQPGCVADALPAAQEPPDASREPVRPPGVLSRQQRPCPVQLGDPQLRGAPPWALSPCGVQRPASQPAGRPLTAEADTAGPGLRARGLLPASPAVPLANPPPLAALLSPVLLVAGPPVTPVRRHNGGQHGRRLWAHHPERLALLRSGHWPAAPRLFLPVVVHPAAGLRPAWRRLPVGRR